MHIHIHIHIYIYIHTSVKYQTTYLICLMLTVRPHPAARPWVDVTAGAEKVAAEWAKVWI